MFSIPSHVRFFHVLFRPALTLQMKSLTLKGLTPSRTWVLHSGRTSVVGLTERLDGWQTACGNIWNGSLWGKAGKNLSCLFRRVGNSQEEYNQRETRDIQREREREPAPCAMPCVKAFTHDCRLVSAERLLVPFVVSTMVSQLPQCSVFMRACSDQLLSSLVWICLRLLRKEKKKSNIHKKHLHTYTFGFMIIIAVTYLYNYTLTLTLVSGHFHPLDCGDNGELNCTVRVLGLNGNTFNKEYVKDRGVLYCCGLAENSSVYSHLLTGIDPSRPCDPV